MRAKGFVLAALSSMVAVLPGCDNVHWGGVAVTLRPPPPPTSPILPEVEPGRDDLPPEPLELGALIYLVERSGAAGRFLPVAEWRDGGYETLPDVGETPELVPRFPLQRWEAGTEFVLLERGVRAGTLVADGSVEADSTYCLIRPAGAGAVELRPGAEGTRSFLAVRKADIEGGLLSPRPLRPDPLPGTGSAADRTSGAAAVARFLIPRVDALWPPSIPEILRETRPFAMADGQAAFSASFVFGDELQVGPSTPQGYALFALARREGTEWVPVWSWHQTARQGKAFPRLHATGFLRDEGEAELLLEVFGTEGRWLAIVGERDGQWDLRYQDPCGAPPAAGSLRGWGE